jgi:hypothetical protein
LIRSSSLRVSSSIIMWEQSTLLFPAAKQASRVDKPSHADGGPPGPAPCQGSIEWRSCLSPIHVILRIVLRGELGTRRLKTVHANTHPRAYLGLLDGRGENQRQLFNFPIKDEHLYKWIKYWSHRRCYSETIRKCPIKVFLAGPPGGFG